MKTAKGTAADPSTALFVGHLPRLNEPVRYRVTLGDAYTDTAEIAMIALPAVEARLTPVPPKYAVKALAAEHAGRQAAVLMGSEVQVAIECTNKKPLQQAWMIVRPVSGSEARRFDVYGPLLPMERPEGELTWWQGAALLIFIAVAGLGLTLAFGS